MPLVLDDRLPKGRLSKSAIGQYAMCPRAYEFRYVEDMASPAKPIMAEGTAWHAVAEAVAVGRATTSRTAYVLLQEELRKAGLDWSPEQETRTEVWIPWLLDPKNIEEDAEAELKVEGMIGDVPMTGFVDHLCSKHGATDYKVTGKAKSQREAETNVEMGVYSLLADTPFVRYVCFVKTKTPKVVEVKAERTAASLDRTENYVGAVGDAIRAGHFPYADPSAWNCAADRCDYWKLCPQGSKGRPSFVPDESSRPIRPGDFQV